MAATKSTLDVSDQSKGHYVNNRQFYELMCDYTKVKKLAKRKKGVIPNPPDRVGRCILLICERLSLRPNFMNYSYRDEMVSDAIENCVMAINSFDPTKSKNPFAYFTRVAFNAFIRRIEREKKQTYIKFKHGQFLEDTATDIQRQEIEALYDPGPSPTVMSGRSRQITQAVRDEVIRKFESRLLTKKRTKAKTPKGIEKLELTN